MEVNATTAFWTSETDLGDETPFQVSLSCDESVHISQLPFSSVQISFSNGRPSCTLHAAGDGGVESIIELGPVHDEPVSKSTGALVWKSGQRMTIGGSVESDIEGEITVCCDPVMALMTD